MTGSWKELKDEAWTYNGKVLMKLKADEKPIEIVHEHDIPWLVNVSTKYYINRLIKIKESPMKNMNELICWSDVRKALQHKQPINDHHLYNQRKNPKSKQSIYSNKLCR